MPWEYLRPTRRTVSEQLVFGCMQQSPWGSEENLAIHTWRSRCGYSSWLRPRVHEKEYFWKRGAGTQLVAKRTHSWRRSLWCRRPLSFLLCAGAQPRPWRAAREESRWKVGGLQMDRQFSYVLCSYLIFNFMISQVFFCSRSTKNLEFILILQHFGTESTPEKIFCFLLFHFLSWAIFKHHKFSLCVPIIRDRHDLHLHDLSSHFLSPTTKFLISYCSLQHFYALGTSKITVFFDFFTCSRSEFLNHELSFDFPIIIVHTWSSFSWRLKDRKKKKTQKNNEKTLPVAGFE